SPLDTPGSIDSFLHYWKPKAIILIESELWPNLIMHASQNGVIIEDFGVNGRGGKSIDDLRLHLAHKQVWMASSIHRGEEEIILGVHTTLMQLQKSQHKKLKPEWVCSCSRVSDFGLMKINNKGRVISFSEKSKGEDLKAMQVDTTLLGLSWEEAEKKPYIAFMGVYVFKKDLLLNLLRWRFATTNEFGLEVIPACASEFCIKVQNLANQKYISGQ
ncbi:hypothetical protein S83_054914, partial [Arachis hypogaea]